MLTLSAEMSRPLLEFIKPFVSAEMLVSVPLQINYQPVRRNTLFLIFCTSVSLNFIVLVHDEIGKQRHQLFFVTT